MLVINTSSINVCNDDDNHEILVARQCKDDKNYYTLKDYNYFAVGSTVAVQ